MKQYTIKRSKFHKYIALIFILVAIAGLGACVYERDTWSAVVWFNILIVVVAYELEIKMLRQRERDIK